MRSKFYFVLLGVLSLPLFAAGASEEPKARILYDTHCGTCHQPDGGGVPFMQPELFGLERANGPKGGVIEMILFGSAAVPAGTTDFGNEMPGFGNLTDEDIAEIATFVRTNFENAGGAVTADDVRAVRDRGPGGGRQ